MAALPAASMAYSRGSTQAFVSARKPTPKTDRLFETYKEITESHHAALRLTETMNMAAG
jgi:hypothetical protein